MSRSEIGLELQRHGYAVVPGALEEPFLARLRSDLEAWIVRCDAIR